jgi:hypothetical protein
MILCFLKSKDLNIPSNIKLEDYGEDWVIVNDKIVAEGIVTMIEAKPEDIVQWLGSREIWVGHGMSGYTKYIVKEAI